MKYGPFFGLLLACLILAFGQYYKKTMLEIKSKMIGQHVESFSLSTLDGQNSLKIPQPGKVTVVNLFASWCVVCASEHQYLTLLKSVDLIGIAWKDSPGKIQAWLDERGNPYMHVLMDERGQSTMPLGLSGVPETYVFDKKGVIRYNKKAGLNAQEIETVILPLVNKLHAE